MKATAFKELIRDAVRDAVRDIIREELAPIKNLMENKSNISNSNRGEKMIFGNTPSKIKPQVKPQKPQSTGNPIYDLLAETKNSMTSDDYNTMITGRSNDAQSFNPQELMKEMGYAEESFNPQETGYNEENTSIPAIRPARQGNVVSSVQEMIASSTPGNVRGLSLENGAEQIGSIQAVPDFTKFMSVLKTKGKL